MSSMFDTDVRIRSKHTPWATVNLHHFILETLMNNPFDGEPIEHQAVLSVRHRHDVASGIWYTLEWTGADGERKSVSAQTYELMKWRAAEVEMKTREKVEREEKADMEREKLKKSLGENPLTAEIFA